MRRVYKGAAVCCVIRMMEDQDFYIDVMSDASMEAHPENQGGCFTVDLQKPISLLAHKWEVGLAEITFTQDWCPLIPEEIWARVLVNAKAGGVWIVHKEAVMSHAQSGKTYRNMTDLWKNCLDALVKKAFTVAKCQITNLLYVKDKKAKNIQLRGTVTGTKRPVRLELSTSLVQMLGFTRTQLVESRYFQTDAKMAIATPNTLYKPKLTRAINSLWVYTDIIQEHVTGSATSTLLRVIDVQQGEDLGRVLAYPSPHYFTLNSNNISSITIKIFTSKGGAPIQFVSPVNCRLYFRQVKK